MTAVSEILMFYGSLSADRLRAKAVECDTRAAAAKADRDAVDEASWRAQAREFRRLARDKEFAA